MKLLEQLNKLKADYQSMIDKSDFTVAIRKRYLDRFKKTWKWADSFQLENATPQINQLFADTLNFYGAEIAKRVTKKAAEKQAYLKSEIQASLDWNDPDKLKATSEMAYQLADVVQNYEQMQYMEQFTFKGGEWGIKVVNGFSAANKMIVDFLNENSELAKVKFKEYVEADFEAKKAKIKKEAEDVIKEI